MEKDSKNKIIVILVILVGFLLLLVGFLLGSKNITQNINTNEHNNSESNNKIDKITTTTTSTTTTTTTKVTTTKKNAKLTKKDETVLKEIEELDKNTDTLLNSESSEEIKDKAKGIFVSLVNFLFYDGEIKGVTFDELSDSGKQKVLEYSKKIDEKIEKKYPNYKDTINTKTKDAYNKASELIKKGAKEISEFSREKLGEDNYNSIIDAKDDIVKYSKKAGSFIKDFSIKTKDKLKSWYENFRNN